MRVLIVTNALPTEARPASGTFIATQIRALDDAGIETDVILLDRAANGPASYVRLPGMVSRRVRRYAPDIVHVMYGGVMAAGAAAATGAVPLVVSFCGSDLLGSPESDPLRRAMARFGVACSWFAASRAAAVIVKSPNLALALPTRARAKATVLPSPVDVEMFRPLDRGRCREELGWRADAFHVLFADSSGDPVKRPELARAAVAALNARGVRAELHELSGVPHALVPRWLNASDCVLLTSAREGSPNIVREALACDIPVVSVPVGDVAEQLAGIAGCFIAEADSRDLADKLAAVRAAGSSRVAGRRRAQPCSLAATAAILVEIYTRIHPKRGVVAA